MTMLGAYEVNQVYNVDALTLLRGLPDGSVNCVVTSPPYFALRSYLDGDAREIGKEAKPDDYVARLVAVFRELRRALRDDGVVFLNLGDTYSNAGKWGGNTGYDTMQQTNVGSIRRTSRNASDLGAKEKELLMIPARVALALQSDGWYLRAEVIWDKGNPMPESVKDRPTRAHEYIYMLTKRPHYWYDADAIATPVQKQSIKRQARAVSATHKNHDGAPGQTPHSMFRARKNNKQDGVGSRRYTDFNERYDGLSVPMANARSVWRIHPKGFKGAHYATFPAELVERCLLAGCPKTVCAVCGAPYEHIVETESNWQERKAAGASAGNVGVSATYQGGVHGKGMSHTLAPKTVRDLGFAPTCSCGAETSPGIVLDIFMGSGTTALVARRLNRTYLGCDINPEYVAMAQARLAGRFEEYQAQVEGKPTTAYMFPEPT